MNVINMPSSIRSYHFSLGIAVIALLLYLNPATAIAQNHMAKLFETALQGEHRSEKQRARDVYRHPEETLLFFGLEPEMTVLEILPGRGWYTAILAPILKDQGQLTVASFGAENPSKYLRNIHIQFIQDMKQKPNIYQNISVALFQRGENIFLPTIADASQDMVLTFRNTHNWIRFGNVITEVYRAMHRVLKPGGVLGVVQHRADKGAVATESAENGYVPESHLIRLLEDIGFELVAKSEINANPKDIKDYPEGVWTLPPSLRLKEKDKEKYLAIGESDRMTLKFVKLP